MSALPLAALMGLTALALVATPASADPARARAHFDLGKRYFEVDEYRKAMEEFKAAHIEEPDPAFLYNIAECHRHLGENREALVFYRRFLQLAPANAPARASIEKRVTELQARIRDEQAAAAAPNAPLPPASAAPSATAAPAPAPASPPASASASSSTSAAPAGERPAVVRPVLEPAAPPAAAPALTLAAEPNAAPESPAASARPFYKRGWFYAVVGGALLAGTLGVWALSSGKGTSVPETPLGNQSAFP